MFYHIIVPSLFSPHPRRKRGIVQKLADFNSSLFDNMITFPIWVHNKENRIIITTRTKASIRYAKENDREKRARKKGRRRDIERDGERDRER